MKKGVWLIIIVVLAFFATVIAYKVISSRSQPTAAQTVSKQPTVAVTTPVPPSRAELLALVNAERKKYGVAPLVEDNRLDTSAQEKAKDETTYNYYDHISPANSPYAGEHGYQFINTVGIHCKTDSENLVQVTPGNNAAEKAVDEWIKSPEHHAAMVDPDYTLTGFGISGIYVVQHFCGQ